MDGKADKGLMQRYSDCERENTKLKQDLQSSREQATAYQRRCSEVEDILVKERTKRLQDIHTISQLQKENLALKHAATSAQQDAVDARKEVLVYIQRLETAHALSHSQQSMITAQTSELNALQVEVAMREEELQRLHTDLLQSVESAHSKQEEISRLTREALRLRDEITTMAVTHTERSKTFRRAQSRRRPSDTRSFGGARTGDSFPHNIDTVLAEERPSLEASSTRAPQEPLIVLRHDSFKDMHALQASPVRSARVESATIAYSMDTASLVQPTTTPSATLKRVARTMPSLQTVSFSEIDKASKRVSVTATGSRSRHRVEDSPAPDNQPMANHITRAGSEFYGQGLGLKKSQVAQYIPRGGSAKECLRRILALKDTSSPTSTTVRSLLG